MAGPSRRRRRPRTEVAGGVDWPAAPGGAAAGAYIRFGHTPLSPTVAKGSRGSPVVR